MEKSAVDDYGSSGFGKSREIAFFTKIHRLIVWGAFWVPGIHGTLEHVIRDFP